MLRVAGEVADGVLLHSFNTPKYTREVVLPNLREGAAIIGRSLEDLDIRGGGFIIVGRSEEDIQKIIKALEEFKHPRDFAYHIGRDLVL